MFYNYNIITKKVINMGRTVWRALAANVSLSLGIVLGVKAIDYLMYDKDKHDMMAEQIEIDYWKKYGHPTEIEGDL
jgi:hypothetical protein